MTVESEITIKLTIQEALVISICLNRYSKDAPPIIGQLIQAIEKELEQCE